VQNGLNARVIAGVVGARRTLACFINFGADYQEPGHILYGSRGSVVIGEVDGKITPRAEALHRVLQDFEPNARLTDNIMGFLWGKMVYGTLLTATALTHETMAASLSDPHFRDMYIALGKEVQRVAATQVARCEAFDGYDPIGFAPNASREETGRSLDAMADFWRHSAKQRSGVWRDIAVRHRKTESTESEDIISIGAENGVATPLNQKLLDMIHEVEEGRLPQALTTLELLKEAAT
jgi:2-dehydropantoate 2-reductase